MPTPPSPTRLVISLTTTRERLPLIKPVVAVLVEQQTYKPDVVALAVRAADPLPQWLRRWNHTTRRPGVLRLVRMAVDYGPASKLLAVLQEGGERDPATVILFCDDDVLMSRRLAAMHYAAQTSAAAPTAFSSRAINIRQQRVLEATGSISVRASWMPNEAFSIATQPDVCRLSDDFWLSHWLSRAGVKLETLPGCKYDYGRNRWPVSCGKIRPLPGIGEIGALSSRKLEADGSARHSGGDWRDQLKRYEACQDLLLNDRLHGRRTASPRRARWLGR